MGEEKEEEGLRRHPVENKLEEDYGTESGSGPPGSGPGLGGTGTLRRQTVENNVKTSGTTGSAPSGVTLGDAPGLAWGLAKGGALGVQEPEGNEVLVGFDAIELFPSIEKELTVQVCRDALLDTEPM